jgi:hypothetical protein
MDLLEELILFEVEMLNLREVIFLNSLHYKIFNQNNSGLAEGVVIESRKSNTGE